MNLTSTHEIAQSQNITCVGRGRPKPIIRWKFGDKILSKNNKVYQIFDIQKDENLIAESVIKIINPISFEKHTQIVCEAHGINSDVQVTKQKSDLINTSKFVLFIYVKIYYFLF